MYTNSISVYIIMMHIVIWDYVSTLTFQLQLSSSHIPITTSVHMVNEITVKYNTPPPSPPPSDPNIKWLVFKRPHLRNRERFYVSFFIIMYGTIFVSEMLNMFEETFEVTEMRTLKHEPFFLLGAEGGSYSWYFTVSTVFPLL